MHAPDVHTQPPVADEGTPAPSFVTSQSVKVGQPGDYQAGPQPVMVRQGDVLLRPIYRVPTHANRETGAGRLVLAEGEATGHSHVLVGPEVHAFSVANGDRLVVVGKPAQLVHEEHASIDVVPGSYQVVVQREFDASAWDGWRSVVD